MGPSDVEWLNVDHRMAKRNKIKTLISTQINEAIRIINVTKPTKNKMKYRVLHVVGAVCLLFLLPCKEEGVDQASGEGRAARSHVRGSPEGRGVEPSFRMRV